MLSFWEKQSFVSYDYAIIGSGIVGLSTAISIKERDPDAAVVIFERGLLPTGASTKNAGFACFGSISELLGDIEALGEHGAAELVRERYTGLLKLRERLGDDNIGYRNYGGYELIREQEQFCLSAIEKINSLLSDIFVEKPFEERSSAAKAFGFNHQIVKSMIYSRYEGQIDTGKMMKSLILKAQQHGVQIMTGAEVVHIGEIPGGVDIFVNDTSGRNIKFKTARLAVCTNAFTSRLFKDLEIQPGRGIVLVTKPIDDLKFKGVFHYDQGYYYFRNYGNRVIFGGGRNIDYGKETTTDFEINQNILNVLKKQLAELILPGTFHEVDYAWAGIMAFGPNKQPILRQHSENVFLGVRLGGMGVAIGSRIGDRLAEMMLLTA